MSTSDEDQERRDAKQLRTNLTVATRDTADLRGSEEPRWRRLRRRLEQEGVAVEDAAVADRAPADTALEFGLLVTRDDRAFSFEFDFLRDEEGRRLEYEDARVSAWDELDQRRRSIYERELQTGREVLAREGPSG